MLQHRDHLGTLTDPEAFLRYVELTAEHGFLVLPDDPDERILRFRGHNDDVTGHFLAQYEVAHAGHWFGVRYEITRRGHLFQIFVDGAEVGQHREPMAFKTPAETNVVLAIVSNGILTGTPLYELRFPHYPGLEQHWAYRKGRFPTPRLPESFTDERPHARDWRLDDRDAGRWLRVWQRYCKMTG